MVDNKKRLAVVLTFEVPSRLIIKENDGFISFYAKILCEYTSNNDKYFYCVFPEPTENPEFSISFDESIIHKENVHYISFIGSDNYSVIPSDCNNQLIFKRKRNNENNAIFSHSGIVFHW